MADGQAVNDRDRLLDALYDHAPASVTTLQKHMAPIRPTDLLASLRAMGATGLVTCKRGQAALLWSLTPAQTARIRALRAGTEPIIPDPEPPPAAAERPEPRARERNREAKAERCPRNVQVRPYIPAQPPIEVRRTGGQIWITAQMLGDESGDVVILEPSEVEPLIAALRAVNKEAP